MIDKKSDNKQKNDANVSINKSEKNDSKSNLNKTDKNIIINTNKNINQDDIFNTIFNELISKKSNLIEEMFH